jgi:DNA-binding XRE family transcriptional regulator
MRTTQLQMVQQCYEFVASSTSPTNVEPAPPIPDPSPLMRSGTSFLGRGVLLALALSFDYGFTNGDAMHSPVQHWAAGRDIPAIPTARSSEMIKTVISMFGLNRSQAAEAMQVRRQSVYNWLGGAEAEGANLDRLVSLYSIARSFAKPIEPHLTVRSTLDGRSSLLRMLSADQLDHDAIAEWTNALQSVDAAPWPPPLDEVLQSAGIERNTPRERQRGGDGIIYIQG